MNDSDLFVPTDATESRYIQCIWSLVTHYDTPCNETILPKGTVELIFNFSERITHIALDNGTRTILPDIFVNGINFTPFRLQKQGRQHLLGVQLTTIGLRSLFGAAVREFNDRVIEGSEVCRTLSSLRDQLHEQDTFADQVSIVRMWLHERIASSKQSDTIVRMHGLLSFDRAEDLSVRSLCLEKGVSTRQLRRLSTEWLGMNTETFLLYRKYRTALHLLHRNGFSLGQVGLEAGYYDQSHFIREFRSFTGMTPTAYRASVTGLPGHILG